MQHDAVQVCLMLSSIVTDGLDDLLIQYFKMQFNISVADIVRSSVCQPAHARCSDDGPISTSAHFSLHPYSDSSSSPPTHLFSAPSIAKHVGDIKRCSGRSAHDVLLARVQTAVFVLYGVCELLVQTVVLRYSLQV